MEKKILKGLMLDDYRHPAENSAFGKLAKMELVGKPLDWLVKKTVEELIEIEEMGTNILADEHGLKEIGEKVVCAAQISDTQLVPQTFVKWGYDFYLTTNGVNSPKLIINSGFFDLLTDDEQFFLIGHEMGHIRSQHLRFLMVCRYWYHLVASIPGSDLLMAPLFYWSRMTDLTADRIGLLTCQDINTALRVMMKLAGVPHSQYAQLNTDSFLKQIDDFQELLDKEGKIVGRMAVLDNAAPWLVNRALELLKWYQSGEYDKVMEKYAV